MTDYDYGPYPGVAYGLSGVDTEWQSLTFLDATVQLGNTWPYSDITLAPTADTDVFPLQVRVDSTDWRRLRILTSQYATDIVTDEITVTVGGNGRTITAAVFESAFRVAVEEAPGLSMLGHPIFRPSSPTWDDLLDTYPYADTVVSLSAAWCTFGGESGGTGAVVAHTTTDAYAYWTQTATAGAPTVAVTQQWDDVGIDDVEHRSIYIWMDRAVELAGAFSEVDRSDPAANFPIGTIINLGGSWEVYCVGEVEKTVGEDFEIAGSTDNDGTYPITAISYTAFNNTTKITTNGSLTSTTADGYVVNDGAVFVLVDGQDSWEYVRGLNMIRVEPPAGSSPPYTLVAGVFKSVADGTLNAQTGLTISTVPEPVRVIEPPPICKAATTPDVVARMRKVGSTVYPAPIAPQAVESGGDLYTYTNVWPGTLPEQYWMRVPVETASSEFRDNDAPIQMPVLANAGYGAPPDILSIQQAGLELPGTRGIGTSTYGGVNKAQTYQAVGGRSILPVRVGSAVDYQVDFHCPHLAHNRGIHLTSTTYFLHTSGRVYTMVARASQQYAWRQWDLSDDPLGASGDYIDRRPRYYTDYDGAPSGTPTIGPEISDYGLSAGDWLLAIPDGVRDGGTDCPVIADFAGLHPMPVGPMLAFRWFSSDDPLTDFASPGNPVWMPDDWTATGYFIAVHDAWVEASQEAGAPVAYDPAVIWDNTNAGFNAPVCDKYDLPAKMYVTIHSQAPSRYRGVPTTASVDDLLLIDAEEIPASEQAQSAAFWDQYIADPLSVDPFGYYLGFWDLFYPFGYIPGDRVVGIDSSGNPIGVVCISANFPTANNEPTIGALWELYWEIDPSVPTQYTRENLALALQDSRAFYQSYQEFRATYSTFPIPTRNPGIGLSISLRLDVEPRNIPPWFDALEADKIVADEHVQGMHHRFVQWLYDTSGDADVGYSIGVIGGDDASILGKEGAEVEEIRTIPEGKP